MKLGPLIAAFAALLTGLCFGAPSALGDQPDHVSWWIEARPWSCSDLVAPLAREVELACDAAGSRCAIARSASEADRRAIITCSDGPSSLEAESLDGQRLWSVTLDGDPNEQLRKAALWIARGEGDAPIVVHPPAPPPAPPTPAPPESLPRDVAAPPPSAVAPPAPSRVGLAVSAFGAHSNFLSSPLMFAGARVAAAAALVGGARLGLAFDAEHTVGSTEDLYNVTAGHLGAILAFGAPWTDDWVGISGEAGGAYLKGEPPGSFSACPSGCSAHELSLVAPSTQSQTDWYLKLSLHAQWPREGGFRPFVGLSYIASNEMLDEWFTLDLGAAWSLW